MSFRIKKVLNLNLPRRKNNRLKDFDYSTPGAYFVTICTYNKQKLFEIEHETESVPLQNRLIHKWLKETEKKFGVTIEKYVIMPNHIHFILVITERHIGRSLQEVMRWFKTMVTNGYIQAVKNGMLKPFQRKIWQKSYYDHIVRCEHDYKDIWEYIEANPLKWEIAKLND